MAVLQKKKNLYFFPDEGFKGSGGSQCLYSGRVLVSEIHERGREKRSITTTGALVKRARRRELARRARKHAGLRLDRAHKH